MNTQRRSLMHKDILALLPGRSNGYSYTGSQLSNWVRVGLRDREGNLVRLEATKEGGQWMVTREAVLEFLERVGRLEAKYTTSLHSTVDHDRG